MAAAALIGRLFEITHFFLFLLLLLPREPIDENPKLKNSTKRKRTENVFIFLESSCPRRKSANASVIFK
jgi:hypothetical protein